MDTFLDLERSNSLSRGQKKTCQQPISGPISLDYCLQCSRKESKQPWLQLGQTLKIDCTNDSDHEKPFVMTCVVPSQGEESESTQVQRHLRVFTHTISTRMFSNIVNCTENICVGIFSNTF